MQQPINPDTFDFDKLPKDRRDFLEIFGNQWGSRGFRREDTRLEPEHIAALREALNPFEGKRGI